MAKSSSFFGIRKGSTKSHTYAAYRGAQITKDRVTDISNPQTSGQMAQRLKMPLVAAAASNLADLVNHSFQGVLYGYESKQKFRSENMRSMNVISYVPKGVQDCGVADFLVSKGSLKTIVGIHKNDPNSNEFLISRLVLTDAEKAAIKAGTEVKIDDAFVTKFLNANPDLQKGDQLTFLQLSPAGLAETLQLSNDVITYVRHNWTVSRLILDATASNSNWTYVENAKGWITDGYICIDLFDVQANLASQPNIVFSNYTTEDPSTAFGEDQVNAQTIVLSRKVGETWQRSTQRMTVYKTNNDVPFYEALKSYTKNKAASNKYLNNGTDTAGITGGTTTK